MGRLMSPLYFYDMYQDLKLSDRARVIQMAVESGITDLNTIEKVYNTFATGGPLAGPGGDKSINFGQMLVAAKKWYQKEENKKKLALKLGAAAKEGAGLSPAQIITALVKKNEPWYDELEAYLYGPERMYEPYKGTSRGPLTGEEYANIPQYQAELNPRGEYVIPQDLKQKVLEAAKTGTNFYINSDKVFDPGSVRFDAANHPIKFRYQNGKLVADAADLYDFDEGYVDRYSEKNNFIKKAILRKEIKEMQSIGTPYIVRQDGIPVRFVGENSPEGYWLDEIEGKNFETGLMSGETGKDYDWVNTNKNLDERLEKAKKFKSGGKIHIKPENRGKFTALKKRTGHSASWFKAHGTPAQKKMATFALNARKWKHEDGGLMTKL